VISTRLNRSRFKQHQLQDQMVLQDLMPKLTGVGSALPHLQDCVYLGERCKSGSHLSLMGGLYKAFASWCQQLHGQVLQQQHTQ
jgi:hypothetical protein